MNKNKTGLHVFKFVRPAMQQSQDKTITCAEKH